jgi:dienelactone hydrolase
LLIPLFLASGLAAQSQKDGSSKDAKKSHAEKDNSAACDSDTSNFCGLAAHFDYPSRLGLDLTEFGVEKRGKALLIDLQYEGTGENDHVPAYLVLPGGNGPYPAIIWGHWMMDGSPLRNRDEFLEEALVLARAGVVSLLIDAPMVRPDYKEKSSKDDPLGWAEQESENERQEIVDLRRGLDLLISRQQVDRHRIAYVGHSFGAHAGAILAGVEKRICCFVLMAGSYSDEEDLRNATSGDVFNWKQQVGKDKVEQYIENYAWDDPANFIGHTDAQSIFLQFATGDHVSREQAQKWLNAFSAKDKKMEFYDAPHALNAAARLDRDRWLQQHLKFKRPDEAALNAIPQLK